MMFDPLDPAFLRNPYPTMARLRDESPVHHVEHLGIWTVSRHADVDAILRAPARFSSELGLGRGWTLRDERPPEREMNFQAGIPGVSVLIGADAPAHTVLRRMLAPAFSRASLTDLRTEIEAATSVLVDELIERSAVEPVDLVAAFAEPLAARGLALALGLHPTTAMLLATWAKNVTTSWDPTHPNSESRAYQRLARQGWDMLRTLRSLLKSDVEEPWPGAIGAMLTAQREDPSAITDMEILSNLVLLVLAGVHTTICGMASTFHLLATRPDIYEIVRRDPSRIPAVVDESLRLESPIQATWRGTWAEERIGDIVVPEGARIWLMMGSANRDERRYDDAGSFVLDRVGPHLIYGTGAHHCIGGILATTELRAAVEILTRRVSSLEVAGPVRVTTNLIIRGICELPVVARR